MPAYLWNTNPRMWSIVPPFTTSLDVLRAYIVDPAAYVYWSTPRLIDEIAVGDAAYIFCTVDNEGIVAQGVVAEAPRHLTTTNADEFAHAARLTPAGWAETVAPSPWKTGIRITRTFWDAPVRADLKPARGGVAQLTEAQMRRIERDVSGG